MLTLMRLASTLRSVCVSKSGVETWQLGASFAFGVFEPVGILILKNQTAGEVEGVLHHRRRPYGTRRGRCLGRCRHMFLMRTA